MVVDRQLAKKDQPGGAGARPSFAGLAVDVRRVIIDQLKRLG